MKAFLCFALTTVFLSSALIVSSQKLWTDATLTNKANSAVLAQSSHLPAHYRLVQLNNGSLAALQKSIPVENPVARMAQGSASIELPLSTGKTFSAAISESRLLDDATQKEHPEIKTYILNDPLSGRIRGRLTVSPLGVSGILFSDEGTAYIHPFSKDLADVYIAYFLKDTRNANKVACGVQDEQVTIPPNLQNNKVTAGDCLFRTYKLAVSATGEYTAWAGSQSAALTRITETVSSVTAIYEREAAIRFTLVSGTNTIYTSVSGDPFPTAPFPTITTLDSNNNSLTRRLGTNAFNLGIVFNNGWNGGLAYRPSVCTSSKGGAAAGLSDTVFSEGPSGAIFVNTVAHEIGHQFSATHSFIASNGSCNGNVIVSTSWEPGGGSTIMAYAGSCSSTSTGDNYYQFYSDDYFHAGNLAQIKSYVTSGGTCATGVATSNRPPVVTVQSASYQIPKSTPFMLSASGADADGNTLMYNWEQMDAGTAATTQAPKATNTNGPNFRSYPPSTDSVRVFPKLSDLAAGINPPYEVLPSITRTLHFRVTARDYAPQGGCTDEQDVSVTTNAGAGPFTVTSQTAATTWAANGSNTATITWNVASTNTAPINCATVDILFSIDGGMTFPYTLLSNTANDGTQSITVPNLVTYSGRVMVKAHSNIFFNVNKADITISSACSSEGATFAPGNNVSAPAGSPQLNLALRPVYGTKFNPAGTITSSDALSYLPVNNIDNTSCVLLGNFFYHDTYTFYVDNPGTYEMIKSAATPFGTVFSIFKDSFNINSPCDNFLNSNGRYVDTANTVYLNDFLQESLKPKTKYIMAVGSFSAAQPAKPFKDSIYLNNAPGSLYNGIPSPGSGFKYLYVIYNKTTNIVKAVTIDADLSNATTFPAGTYVVYGFSCSSSVTGATLAGYIGGSFTTLSNDLLFKPSTLCGNLSKNFIEVKVTGALPVTLLPLTATKVKRTSQLQWATATEQNSAYFEIQRSADSRSYQPIDKVNAKGNSSVKVDYSYVDKNPLPGNNYYQLKQVDKDGRYAYSNVVGLSFDETAFLSGYPNPVKSVINLKYVTAKNESAEIQVYDSKGTLVTKTVLNAQAGVNTKAINVSGFAKGVYAVRLISNAQSFTLKFTKE